MCIFTRFKTAEEKQMTPADPIDTGDDPKVPKEAKFRDKIDNQVKILGKKTYVNMKHTTVKSRTRSPWVREGDSTT